MVTDAPDRCSSCGAQRPVDAPGGLCPRCLLRQALDAESLSLSQDGEVGATIDLTGPPNVLDTLAASVGPVPRILLRDTDAGAEPPLVRPPDRAANDATIRYRIDGEIARGGMGAVLKGRDPDLGRDVAMKVLRDDLGGNPEMVRRFVEEAQIGGQLQHPGIVPVYELGTFADSRPFFTMKLVKGRTLATLLGGRSSPAEGLPRILGIFEQIAQTVAYAHARGVIHRDLKPSNVMVGSFGEVQVMDWGLAKVLPRGGAVDDGKAGKLPDQETLVATARSTGDSDVELSHAGSIMGTPSYMAPEQARGEIDVVDERADAFALGSILCEILTGSPAFTGRTSGEIHRRASRGETADALARLAACAAEAELVALARDCLAVDPEDRPRDAGAVASRVIAYLGGVQDRLRAAELERARAETRAAEERRRRRLQLGLAASLLALVGLSGLAFTYAVYQRQARAARADRLMAEASLLRDQALATPDVVDHWRRASEAVDRIAEDLGASAEVETLRRQILTGLADAERDRDLVARLVDIRSDHADGADGSATDAAYISAFADAGMDPDRVEPDRIGIEIRRRPAPVAAALVAALDHWATMRRGSIRKTSGWRQVLAAARAADPDPDREALRAALFVEDKAERLEFLRPLAKRADAGSWAPASLILLGGALVDAGDSDAGVAVLERASWAHPDDALVHFALAVELKTVQPPQPEEEFRAYSASWALKPELSGHSLAHTLEDLGRDAEAETVWIDLIGRRPDNGNHLSCYGHYLNSRGRHAESAEALNRAIAALREMISHRPNTSALYYNLARALHRAGNVPGAIAEYREAIRLSPDEANLHCNLGNALRDSGDMPGAIAEYREAIRLEPDHIVAHLELGNVSRDSGNVAASLATYKKLTQLRPANADAHYGFGLALQLSGDVPGAMAEYREAIRLRPSYAEAHCNLGQALTGLGRYDEGLAELRTGHDLGSKRAVWPYPSAAWLARAERLAALAERLPVMVDGKDRLPNNAERLALAPLLHEKKRYAAAARLWAEAMEADPKIVDDLQETHRYNAACCAVLAATGEGEDDPKPDDDARLELRRQALGWLKSELAAWSELLESGDARARAVASSMLRHWQTDPDLASVREPDALTGLPEPERADWQALWEKVDHLLKG